MTQAQTTYLLTASRFELVPARAKGNAQPYGILNIPSSDGKREYRVDITNQRCSCPAWKFSKTRQVCKHLRALGYKDSTPVVARAVRAQTNYEVEL